ncbi:MAG: DEAD/DEAH box helicase [Thermoprotei archaeon]|nr:DEAD/DEAH box helicase [TACK group archaeon]
MQSFGDFSSELRKALLEEGYVETTPIQELAMPHILRGRNVLIVAPTGSGKTEAAIFPSLQLLMEHKDLRVIYVTPLKSLNRDITERISGLCNRVGLTIALRHGDTTSWERAKISKNPPRVLITTPELFEGLLISPSLSQLLKEAGIVIVDEAQELVNTKRGAALSLALERLAKRRGEFQRIALSAYSSSLEQLALFAFGKRDHVTAKYDGNRPMEITVSLLEPGDEDKVIRSEIAKNRSTLIFTNTRQEAEVLGKRLGSEGMVAVHHGSLSREEREEAEREFKAGKIKGLVCTSSLELGIDVGSVDEVIQFGSPRRVETFFQRIGRAGHRQGGVARGKIITTNLLDYLESLVISKRTMLRQLEELPPPSKNLDVFAHELVGLLLDQGALKDTDLIAVFSRSPYCPSDVEAGQVLATLERMRVVRRYGGLIKKTLLTKKYYAQHISMLPNQSEFRVFDAVTHREVGSLDREFVVSRCQNGSLIRLGGKDWRVSWVNPEAQEVWMTRASGLGAIPSWEGELIPVEKEVAQAVSEINLDEPEIKALTDATSISNAKQLMRNLPYLGKKMNFFSSFQEGSLGLKIWSPNGTKANTAFSLAFSRYLAEKDISIRHYNDQYWVNIETIRPVPQDLILNFFALRQDDVKFIYLNGLLSSPLYLSRLYRVCVRLGLINENVVVGQPFMMKVSDAWKGTWVEQEAVSEIEAESCSYDALQSLLSAASQGEVDLSLKEPLANLTLTVEGLETQLELVGKRILETEVKLTCLICGWQNIFRVKDVPEKIACPRCGSSLIGCTSPRSQTEGLVEKVRSGRKLSPEEKKAAEELNRSASLIQSLGRTAIFVLAGRGIGPETASRILVAKSHSKAWPPMDLLPEIVQAEQQFNRTHMFWDKS